jgi:hypothetical protein
VAPAERIATFDNDGTLWCEKPQYVQAEFVFGQLRAWIAEGSVRRARRVSNRA